MQTLYSLNLQLSDDCDKAIANIKGLKHPSEIYKLELTVELFDLILQHEHPVRLLHLILDCNHFSNNYFENDSAENVLSSFFYSLLDQGSEDKNLCDEVFEYMSENEEIDTEHSDFDFYEAFDCFLAKYRNADVGESVLEMCYNQNCDSYYDLVHRIDYLGYDVFKDKITRELVLSELKEVFGEIREAVKEQKQ